MFRMVLEEVPMGIVCGLDIHRSQVTFDWVDVDTGEGGRGKLAPANRETFRRWLEQFAGHEVDVVVEGCTGWRFIIEECRAAGVRPHVAYPAEASIRIHGVKRRAKTDKVDAKGLRELGVHGRVPESWIPPAQVLEIRTAVRLYHDLMTDRAAWLHLHSRDVVRPGRSGADATAAR
jgi:transposase